MLKYQTRFEVRNTDLIGLLSKQPKSPQQYSHRNVNSIKLVVSKMKMLRKEKPKDLGHDVPVYA